MNFHLGNKALITGFLLILLVFVALVVVEGVGAIPSRSAPLLVTETVTPTPEVVVSSSKTIPNDLLIEGEKNTTVILIGAAVLLLIVLLTILIKPLPRK